MAGSSCSWLLLAGVPIGTGLLVLRVLAARSTSSMRCVDMRMRDFVWLGLGLACLLLSLVVLA
jgi:hypothetical protein